MKRPTFTLSDKQNKYIAKEVFSEFKANFEDAAIQENDIYDLMRSSEIDCGYGLAKELENNCGARVDTLIVEELGTIGYQVLVKQQELEKQWVKDNNITPKFKTNDKVFYATKHEDENSRELRKRNINGIDLKSGKYKIEVNKGDVDYSWLVNFEDIELLNGKKEVE